MSSTTSYLELCRRRREQIAHRIRTSPADSYEAIGAEFGITRQRVDQIARLYGLRRRPSVEDSAQTA